MSLPKFTAELSIGNYGSYADSSRKYKNYNNPVKIVPAIPKGDGELEEFCQQHSCRTQRCRARCGNSMCEGTRSVCNAICYNYITETFYSTTDYGRCEIL